MDTGDGPTNAALCPLAVRCLVLFTGNHPTPAVSLPVVIGCPVLPALGRPADTGCLVLTTCDVPTGIFYQPG